MVNQCHFDESTKPATAHVGVHAWHPAASVLNPACVALILCGFSDTLTTYTSRRRASGCACSAGCVHLCSGVPLLRCHQLPDVRTRQAPDELLRAVPRIPGVLLKGAKPPQLDIPRWRVSGGLHCAVERLLHSNPLYWHCPFRGSQAQGASADVAHVSGRQHYSI